MSKSNIQSNNTEPLEITAEPSKVVPKLVTKVGVAKASTGNVVLSLVFELPGEKAHLVERVIIDSATTDELIKVLKASKEVGDVK